MLEVILVERGDVFVILTVLWNLPAVVDPVITANSFHLPLQVVHSVHHFLWSLLLYTLQSWPDPCLFRSPLLKEASRDAVVVFQLCVTSYMRTFMNMSSVRLLSFFFLHLPDRYGHRHITFVYLWSTGDDETTRCCFKSLLLKIGSHTIQLNNLWFLLFPSSPGLHTHLVGQITVPHEIDARLLHLSVVAWWKDWLFIAQRVDLIGQIVLEFIVVGSHSWR